MAWAIDASHSLVQFSVRHMMLAKTRGTFDRFSGTVEFDEANPANSAVSVQIETASINSKDDKRDAHLRSPDFLDVDNFPAMTFVSKRVEQIDDSNGRIIGDLTIRGETREVTLDAHYIGKTTSPWGTTNAGFSAETKINRKDWGLTWNVALEKGGWLVGEEVTISIELELIYQPEVAQEEPEAVGA